MAPGGPIRGQGGPMPGGAVIDPAAGSGLSANTHLKQVDRVRNIFPETWLWNSYSAGFVKVLQFMLLATCVTFAFSTACFARRNK